MKKSLLLLVLLLNCTVATAEPTHYISDKLYAPVRSEASDKGKTVHNGLESGTAVEVLEKNDKAGFTRVRTADKTEGWVRSQYLSSEPTASVQLEQANAMIAQLQAEKAALEEELQAIKQISASQIDTHARNTELVKQNQLLISEKEVLLTDNERLKNRQDQTWFLYGGLLVVLSIVVSTLATRLGRKRRYDGWA